MHRFAFALGLLLFYGGLLGAPPPSAAPFWLPPGVGPVLSPGGGWVAWITGDETDGTLWVAPFESPQTGQPVPIPAGRGRARDLAWTGAEELVVLSLGGQGGGFWLLRRPGEILQPLTPPPGFTFVRLLHPQPMHGSRICLEGFANDPGAGKVRTPWLDLLTVDAQTGRVVQVAQNSGDVVEWFADGSGTARLALAVSGKRQELRVRREDASGLRWRTVESWDLASDSASVLAVSSDGSRAWISARLGRDTRGVYGFDLAGGRFSHAIAVDDRFDLDGPLLMAGDVPTSLSWERLTPHTEWLDAEWRSTAEAVAGPFPGVVWKPVSVSRDGSRAVLARISDRFPAEYVVVSRGDPGGARQLPSKPGPPPVAGIPRNPVELTARDGEVVTGYVTGLEGRSRKPMVILVHGGPWTRDVWGWDPESQFLASRGWGILQVNYRGSAGFGRRFQEAGAGHWAGAPTSDLVDGVRWAVAQGLADPLDIVVVGKSFGGFLAFASMTGDEDPFRAGVTVGGVFDLSQWLDSRGSSEPPFVRVVQRRRLLGAIPPDSRWVERRLARLRHPLLVVQAQDDEVVPAFLAEGLSHRAAGWKVPMSLRKVPSGGHLLHGAGNAESLWEEVAVWLSQPRKPSR